MTLHQSDLIIKDFMRRLLFVTNTKPFSSTDSTDWSSDSSSSSSEGDETKCKGCLAETRPCYCMTGRTFIIRTRGSTIFSSYKCILYSWKVKSLTILLQKVVFFIYMKMLKLSNKNGRPDLLATT